MAEVDDSKVFGDFLLRAKHKAGKTDKQIKIETGFGAVSKWHMYESFPALEKLPIIALAYEVDLGELTEVFHKAKAGRKAEEVARKGKPQRRVTLNDSANYDPPGSGRVTGKGHSYRNSGGR